MDTFTVSSIMEVIKGFFPNNTSIAVSDPDKYIYYKPSKIVDLKIQPGDHIKEGSATFKALSNRQKVTEYVDSDIYGVPYFGMSVPVFEDERPAGAVTTILPAKPSPIATNFITIRAQDRWYPILYEDILYLEAESRKTKVQATRGNGYHKLNLSELEIILPNHLFIRVHRSYIVNVNYIREIQPDSHSTFLLIMKNDMRIPVSQTYSSFFRKALYY
ncbi:DNA-binding LytR/AlgR family response regulator [Oikeobacillus pervagus]|uniref:DNA-binding LytR/AlgR family response regulator n=1 Tax=Oikeobacillus pervagus TaxID=1325931 RepID=A0AAJ1WJC7_9BACI|nr:LytTR family DNA-binding domain-containing protein [Oikeobacillus pervagus]MDQ0215328.1 DNA-binding LytR/AlgR family response regulator [Oikeobacillus pervagus]